MFKKLFGQGGGHGGGGGGGGGGGTSHSGGSRQVTANSTQKTVDAIQKLGEVCIPLFVVLSALKTIVCTVRQS